MHGNSLTNIVHIVAADNVDAYRRGGSRYYRSYRSYYYSRYYYYSYYGYSYGGSSRYVLLKKCFISYAIDIPINFAVFKFVKVPISLNKKD